MAEETQEQNSESENTGDSLENSPNNSAQNPSAKPGQEDSAQVTVEDAHGEALAGLKPNLIHRLLNRFNIYIFLLVILVMLAITFILIAYFGSQNSSNTASLVNQNLSPATLKQIASNETNIGSSNQVLNVSGSAIFSGNVLARSTLQVAGNLSVGGSVALNNLSIDGTGQFGQLNVSKNLSVAGDDNVQGNSTIGKSLQVNGGATFGGAISAPQITVTSLNINGDLVINHHIDTGGSIPSAKSDATLGSGGTVSISGNDTAGNVVINSGTNVTPGCMATISFASAFNKTPYVEITPVGSSAGGLAYYVIKTNTSFSICDSTAPPANSSFGFDFFVVD